jgi:hypothetical protein
MSKRNSSTEVGKVGNFRESCGQIVGSKGFDGIKSAVIKIIWTGLNAFFLLLPPFLV